MKTAIRSFAWAKSNINNFTVFVLSLLVQMILIGKYLDNDIVSRYALTAVDAADYANRAQIWKNEGFSLAFDDAYRMPGYPSLIFAMSLLFPNQAFLATKLFQMFGLALSAVIIKLILEKLATTKLTILGTTLFILLPNWHFTPILLAESLTATCFIGLIFFLSRVSERGATKIHILGITFLVAALTYLKPNNLLLIIPVLVFLYFKVNHGAIRSISFILALFVLLMSPWIGFAKKSNPGFYGLTTNSGINLYVGTGMIVSYDGGALSNAALRWRVDPKNNPRDVVELSQGLSPLQVNQLFQDKAIQIWKERPVQVFVYGLEKMLIAFGFKGNSPQDYVLGLFNLGALIAGMTLLRFPNFRIWGITLLSIFLVLAAQAVIFQADRRFIVPVFSPIAVINLTLVFSLFATYKGKLKTLSGK